MFHQPTFYPEIITYNSPAFADHAILRCHGNLFATSSLCIEMKAEMLHAPASVHQPDFKKVRSGNDLR
jgi:hypothetical protein